MNRQKMSPTPGTGREAGERTASTVTSYDSTSGSPCQAAAEVRR